MFSPCITLRRVWGIHLGTLANRAFQIGGASESQRGCVLRKEEGGTETVDRGAEDRKGGRQDQGSIGRIRLLGVAFHNIDCGERGTVCWRQGRLALVLEAVSLIASGVVPNVCYFTS